MNKADLRPVPPQNQWSAPWAMTVKELAAAIGTDEIQGLSSNEAEQRLATYGRNTIPEPDPEPLWKRYWGQLTGDAVVRLLLIGAVVSLLLGDYLEGVAILVMLNIMAGFGLWQEGKATDAARSLRQFDNPVKLVVRNGARVEISMDQIVPGDVVYLPHGSVAPADGRIIAAVNAEKDTSKLTGESLSVPVETEPLPPTTVINAQKNMIHRGDAILSGNLTIIVTATGSDTEIGKIASRLAESEETTTPLDEQLDSLGDAMAKIFIWIAAIVIGFGTARQLYTTSDGFRNNSELTVTFIIETLTEAFINAVALIIAAIPEGLPAVLTITLAIAIKTMVRRNALIRKPKAVEGGGSMTVLLTDKTGTLTANQMEVTHLYLNNQIIDLTTSDNVKALVKHDDTLVRAVKIARHCNNSANPTEVAMLRWIEKAGFESVGDIDHHQRSREHEFDQTLKRMTTVYPASQTNQHYILTKGAPEQVVQLCNTIHLDGQALPIELHHQDAVNHAIANLASKGLRVIALAERTTRGGDTLSRQEAETDLTFVGMLGIMDPPREDVPHAVSLLETAGIRTVMVTGDNPLTAYHVARMVGIIQNDMPLDEAVITGDELSQLEDPTPAFLERLHSVRVFARVTPHHKAQIVHAMKSAGFIVGMTGDGVNDAIALKESDIGFAMGNGTDVAREASDVVILDSRFGTIPNAVEEGRNVIHRIRLYLSYILSGNGCEVGAFIVAYLIGLPIPLTALVLLVINFATDSFPALAMAFEPGEEDVMEQSPRKRDAPFINPIMWVHIGVQTVAASIIIMGVYYAALTIFQTSLEEARASAFMAYIFQKLYRAFTARSLTRNVWEIGLFRNRYSIGAVFISFSIALFCTFVPVVNTALGMAAPGWNLLLITVLVGFIPPVAEEITKLFLKQKHTSQPATTDKRPMIASD